MLVAAVLTLPAFLLAAKAHGRQVRLERERAGHHEVTFGSGANHPFVEALWRRDRVAFWTIAPLCAIGFALLLFVGARAGAWAWLAIPWGMIAAFTALGAASAMRTRDARPWLWGAIGLSLATAVAAVAWP